MEGWRSGRSFLVRLARDSRKWNLAALVASQNPKDILGLDVQNLVSTVFVGRIAEDQEIASEALRLLRVPVARRLRGDAGLALPGRHVLVEPAGLPRVRDARRGRPGAEGARRRLVRGRSARAPGHHAGGGGRRRELLRILVRPGGLTMVRRACRCLVLTMIVAAVASHRPGRWPASAGRGAPPPVAKAPGGAVQHRGVAGRLPGLRRPSHRRQRGRRAQCLKPPTPEHAGLRLGGLVRRAADVVNQARPAGHLQRLRLRRLQLHDL